MYQLLESPRSVEILGVWENHTGNYSEVLGYTVLGSIILRAPETNEYLVLHPRVHGSNAKQYGEFDSIEDFEERILKDEGFIDYCIDPFTREDISALTQRVGKLEKEESYFPVPDPCIGGSGELDTFKKGNVWVSTDISGQNRGLE